MAAADSQSAAIQTYDDEAGRAVCATMLLRNGEDGEWEGLWVPEMDLSQAEADGLLAMEKHEEGRQVWHYPTPGSSIAIPLASVDGRESFLLDMYRGRIALERGSHQNRARKVVILARLDFGGAPHRNPDGEEIGSPHLHLYRQGYGDKWAYPLPSDHFPKPSDAMQLLQDFMRYCNVTKRPVIQQGIFA